MTYLELDFGGTEFKGRIAVKKLKQDAGSSYLSEPESIQYLKWQIDRLQEDIDTMRDQLKTREKMRSLAS